MRDIKVVQITNNDLLGGASRCVLRLNESLIDSQIDSKILVLDKYTDLVNVLQIARIKIFRKASTFIDSLPSKLYSVENKFSCGLYGRIPNPAINLKAFDIIHIHWINDGTLSIKTIKKLCQLGKPVVLSLHDMWALTGGCHYNKACENFKQSCGNCPELNSNFRYDLSYILHKVKNYHFSKSNFTVVVGSNWLKSRVYENSFMKNKLVRVIPPNININIYKPIDKNLAKNIFNLPKKKTIILFGAISATTDSRKGFDKLYKALKLIGNDKELLNTTELVIFGASKPNKDYDLLLKSHFIGRLDNDYSLATLYSAADLTIVPSLQEAFGQVATESMACGTPVVGFNNTGLDDIIVHKHNGYLVSNQSSADLYNGILWVLGNKDKKKS